MIKSIDMLPKGFIKSWDLMCKALAGTQQWTIISWLDLETQLEPYKESY